MIRPETLLRFKEIYCRLLVADLQRRLAGRLSATVQIAGEDYRFLIMLASQIALGVDFPDAGARAVWQLWAYDAVTRIAAVSDPASGWVAAADVILARLGNFPARSLLQNLAAAQGVTTDLPLVLALQADARELENTVKLSTGTRVVLTDFQYRLFGTLAEKRAVSFSAPTSAGKSFLLGLDIVRRLSERRSSSIVYVVPTRALIRQVMRDLRRQLVEANLREVVIVSAPVPVSIEQRTVGVVYVLTQERLLTLLTLAAEGLHIDTLFVDEAQEVSDENRGMTLHSAVQRVIDEFPNVQTFFSSPLTWNPGYLLSEFQLTENSTSFVEPTPAVSQSLIFLKEVDRDPRSVDVEVLTPDGPSAVGRMPVDYYFRGAIRRLARTAMAFTRENETSLVYANKAAYAELMASIIADLLPVPETLDPAIADFIAFLSVHIHPSYTLISYLSKGVAFHYGDMPHIVRTRVEELARDRRLRFICCTSTLLQGINLPAKNIFLFKPLRGSGNAMTSTDFWNLAGRAGRLREVFSGNVWCIARGSWKEDPLNGPRLGTISSSFTNVLLGDKTYEPLLKRIDGREAPSDGSPVEQAFGKVFSEFTLCDRSLPEAFDVAPPQVEKLQCINDRCLEVRRQTRLPLEVFIRNPSISPWRLEAMYDSLLEAPDLSALLPTDPRQGGTFDRLCTIFQLINAVFFRKTNNSHRYFAGLATRWISGRTLSEMIRGRLTHYEVPDDDIQAINSHIRQLLDALEHDLPYRYVKYLKAYADVIAVVLQARGRSAEATSLPPLHLYIELGAYDGLLITLMSLGLSRTTAILLRRGVAQGWSTGMSKQVCLENLRALDRKAVNLPDVCWREVRDVIG